MNSKSVVELIKSTNNVSKKCAKSTVDLATLLSTLFTNMHKQQKGLESTIQTIKDNKLILNSTSDQKDVLNEYIKNIKQKYNSLDREFSECMKILNTNTFEGNEVFGSIYNALINLENELSHLSKIVDNQSRFVTTATNKNLNTVDNLKIYTMTAFEVYCIMLNGFKSNSYPQQLKKLFDEEVLAFYKIFSSIQVELLPNNTPLIKIDPKETTNLIEFADITFDPAWYQTKKTFFDLVDPELGIIFNRLMTRDKGFAKTVLGENYPYMINKRSIGPRIFNLFNVAGSPSFVNQTISDQEFKLNCHYGGIDINRGQNGEIKLDFNCLGMGGTKRKAARKKTKKKKRKVKESEEEEEEENKTEDSEEEIEGLPDSEIGKILQNRRENNSLFKATSTDVTNLLGKVRTMINDFASKSTKYHQDLNQLIGPFTSGIQSLFFPKQTSSLDFYKWDVDSLLSRCTTLKKGNFYEIENALALFTRISTKLGIAQSKNPGRPVFIKSNETIIQNAYNDVFRIADFFLSSSKTITIVKINDFNTSTSKASNNHDAIKVIDGRVILNVDSSFQSEYFKDLFKGQVGQLENELNKLRQQREVLDLINAYLDTNPQLKEWFGNDNHLFTLKKSFPQILDLKVLNQGQKQKHPFLNSIKKIEFPFENLFKSETSSSDIEVKYNKDFNEALRIFYFSPWQSNIFSGNVEMVYLNTKEVNIKLYQPSLFTQLYPTCWDENCDMANNNNPYLYHLPANCLEFPQTRKVTLPFNQPQSKDFLPFSFIIYYQAERNNYNYNKTDGMFDLKLFDDQIDVLLKKLDTISKYDKLNLSIEVDNVAQVDESLGDCMCKTNTDRSIEKGQDTTVILEGASGAGKTNTCFGNGRDSKGFLDTILSNASSTSILDVILAEHYVVNFPFEDSFIDANNLQLTKPTFRIFDVDSSCSITISKKNGFDFTNPINSLWLAKNFNQVRNEIDKIRLGLGSIAKTKNNPDSSRSAFYIVTRIRDTLTNKTTYSVIIDRPGLEEPSTTFDLVNKNYIFYQNPLVGYLNFLQESVKDSFMKIDWLGFVSSIGLLIFEESTYEEHLKKNLGHIKFESSQNEIAIPHYRRFSTDKYTEPIFKTKRKFNNNIGCDFNEYKRNHLSNVLNLFMDENITAFEELEQKFTSILDTYDAKVKATFMNLHKSNDFLDFVITCPNFIEKNNRYENLIRNGFANKSIKIRELFNVEKILDLIQQYDSNSKFLSFFKKDNFLKLLLCPVLGNCFEFFNYKVNNTALLLLNQTTSLSSITFGEQNNLNTVTGLNDEDSLLYPLESFEYSLNFKKYCIFSKFGNQSFLNSYESITTFLFTMGVYWSIFKNPNVNFLEYQDKIKMFYNFNKDLQRDVLKYCESVAINETNNNIASITNTKINIPTVSITFNDNVYECMELFKDVIVPDTENRKYNANITLNKFTICDLTGNSHGKINFREKNNKINVYKINNFQENLNRIAKVRVYNPNNRFLKDPQLYTTSRENFPNNSKPIINNSTIVKLIVANLAQLTQLNTVKNTIGVFYNNITELKFDGS